MKGDEGTSATEEQKKKLKRICVFCGSRAGYMSSFSDAALQLRKELVKKKIDLVYGGGSVGLMGLVSKTVHEGGCHVTGIIPRALLPHEISGKTYGELNIVADMHQRKSEMEKHADAFIALPGGYGTMEEFLEMITWAQLGIHEKPVRSFSLKFLDINIDFDQFFPNSEKDFQFCFHFPHPKENIWFGQVGLLNVDGYYDGLLELFDMGVEEGFIEDSARYIMVLGDRAEELIKKMEEYAAVHEMVCTQTREVDQ